MGREEAAVGAQHLPPASQFQKTCFPPLPKGSNWSQDLFKASACRNETLQETSPKQKNCIVTEAHLRETMVRCKQAESERGTGSVSFAGHSTQILSPSPMQPAAPSLQRWEGEPGPQWAGHWLTCAQEECDSRSDGESAQREDTLSQRNLDKSEGSLTFTSMEYFYSYFFLNSCA